MTDKSKIFLGCEKNEQWQIMSQKKPLPFVFIHIPKTAGSSIKEYLSKKYNYKINAHYERDGDGNQHDTLFQIESINNLDQNTFIFSVCRNPYRRSYSYYKYYIKENIISKYLTFEEYLKEIDDTPFKNLRQDHYNQGWWIISKNNYINRKIYYFENLLELEKDFDCKLPKINSTYFNVDSYIQEYTEDSKKMVLDIYYDDFQIFGYDKSWENSFKKFNYQ